MPDALVYSGMLAALGAVGTLALLALARCFPHPIDDPCTTTTKGI